MMEDTFRIGTLEELFGETAKTIRKYVNLYSSHFSEGAVTDIPGQHRFFTRRDLQMYGTIQRLRSEGKSPEDIALWLADPKNTLDPIQVSEESFKHDPAGTALVVRQQLADLARERDVIFGQLQAKEEDLHRLSALVEDMQKNHSAQVERLLNEARMREGELREEIGALKAELRKNLPPTSTAP